MAATLGPLSALIGIRLFGYVAPQRYHLAAQAAAAYCLIWTDLIYSGAALILQRLWEQCRG